MAPNYWPDAFDAHQDRCRGAPWFRYRTCPVVFDRRGGHSLSLRYCRDDWPEEATPLRSFATLQFGFMAVESSMQREPLPVSQIPTVPAAALEHADRELTAIMRLLPSAVRVVDLSGRIVRANARAERELGDVSPSTVRELWERDQPRHLEDNRPLAFLESPAMRALAGISVHGELLAVQGVRADEPRVLESSAEPTLDDDGRVVGVVLIDRDVTDSRRLERTLDREALSSSELESRVMTEADRIERIVDERARALAARDATMSRDRRLAAIGQLAAGVMHDVNNALNPIMAAAYLLRHHAESPDAVRDYADRIRKAAETGAATASRVGRFIRQEPLNEGVDEVLDLSAVTEEVLELTAPIRQQRPHGGSEVRVVRDYGSLVTIRGIPGEIREALLNLVSNALDAMPQGGTLTVRTLVCDHEALVVIEDDGLGMSAEVRERAFEPFFTTKGAAGSGLGLAEVYGIARRHRGSASIASAPCEGAAITLSFPVERRGSPLASLRTPTNTLPLHILVVEDHDDGREFLRRVLCANGHTVDAVSDVGAARLRLAAATASTYQMLLTDIGLPDGNGWDLVALARDRMPTLRIGVITGWEPMVTSAEALGAEFVLRKPLHSAELLAHIAREPAPVLPEQLS